MNELEYSDFLKMETDLEREAELISLEHHGIKGMKWGVRRSPEQLGHRTKKRSIFSKVKKAVKKTAKKTKKATEKKEEESAEKIREKVLKSTDPRYIAKHLKYLDDNELQGRINRISKETTIKKMAADASGKKAMKNAEDFLKQLSSMAESAQKIYIAYDVASGRAQRRRRKEQLEDAARRRREQLEDEERRRNQGGNNP